MIKKIRFAVMKKIIAAFLLSGVLFYGCETDFDVIAPYKEVMVIDGLLNVLDSVHTVRISKAFLGVGNALVMAQQNDSLTYGDILDVKMQRLVNGSVTETFSLSRTEYNDKDTGVFASRYVLYSTTHPIFDDGSEYKIIVANNQTGVVAGSTTKIVKDMVVSSPNPLLDSVDLTGPALSIARYSECKNAVFYELIIRFHYRDIDPLGISTQKYVDWYFSTPSVINTAGVRYNFYKYDLFQNLGLHIPDNPGYTRRIDSLTGNIRPFEFILLAGSEDLQTYIQLNKPSTGNVQERPSFTTVENGLGLFTSRVVHSEFKHPNLQTVAAFDTCVFTRNKNFQFN